MFDPFKDFQTAGYLRNIERLQDLDEVKVQEHVFFEANLEEALAYLQACEGAITYPHFLEVHRLLFGEFYPWAGQDRYQLGVGRLVGKGADVQFEVSELCQQAVEWGLRLGNDPAKMRSRPGQVMGAFAWGHPFLDGNGRTMLLVHGELARRAGFAINWLASKKGEYLAALTHELERPNDGHLDRYLRPLMVACSPEDDWVNDLKSLPGLDGAPVEDRNIVYGDHDPEALARYQQLKHLRGDDAPDATGLT